jgi:hypothetical protein
MTSHEDTLVKRGSTPLNIYKICVQDLTGCCPNHFSLPLKHFLINLKLVSGDSKTRPLGSNSWNRFSFTSPRFMGKKRFNERSKRFSFGQQPVELRILAGSYE